VVQKYAYDPWGARRNPDDWTQKDSRTSWITNRGYTGHEHLDAFGVIDMNGRVYDPLTAQFLSPDPELQAPGDWLNYNRYSYCFGNPMRYTDPSGYQTARNLSSQKTPTEDEQLAQWAQAWRQYYAMQDVMRSIQEQMRQSNMYVPGPPMGYQPETSADKFWAEHGYVRNAAGVYTMLPGYGDPRYGYWETTTTTYYSYGYYVDNDGNAHYSEVTETGSRTESKYVYDQTAGQNGAGGWMSDAWSWAKDHFYVGVEGEITYGTQFSGIINKGIGLNINVASEVVTEAKISNRGSYVNNYSIAPLSYMDKGKALDFGIAWEGGVNYNWNIENGKYVSSTLSAGYYGIGGSLTWNSKGVTDLFLGLEIGGKVAAGWGASGSVKIGFTWNFK